MSQAARFSRLGRPADRAFSLLETIIAFGILVASFTLFFSLYGTALRYSGRTGRRIMAANVAQRQLAKLRAWAAEPAGPGRGFYDWSSKTDTTFADQDHPDYLVRIQSADSALLSPSSRLIVGGTTQKAFTTTYRKVQITVSWGQESLQIVSLVADPSRRLRAVKPVVVVGAGGGVAKDATVVFTVQVFDSDDRPIPDVMAKWYVKAITGTGKIKGNEDGSSATFTNLSEKMDGTPQYTGGECEVTAHVVYCGQEAWGESNPLMLAP